MRGAVAGAWARDRYGVTAKQTKKVDAVQYCVDRMTFLAGEIKAKQAAARAVPDPAAFVTFADRRTQVLATQALHHHDTSVWHVTGAPAPGAVLWPALAQRSWERTVRAVGVWGAFIALCLLYLIPVGAIQKWVTSGCRPFSRRRCRRCRCAPRSTATPPTRRRGGRRQPRRRPGCTCRPGWRSTARTWTR